MRIASLSPAVTEILFALGLEEQIVCTDQFSNFPEEAKDIPHLRDHQDISLEDLIKYEPELVCTSTVIQEKLAEKLRNAGSSSVHFDTRSINTLYEGIRQMGLLFSVEQEAEELILSMQQGFNDVKKKAGLLPSRAKLYIEEWHEPPMASGNWVPEIAHLAGCQQFPISAGELSREVTLEEVAAYDPDLIVISWCGAGLLADPALLTGRAGWGDLRAVSEGNIRVIDDSLLNRPGPRLVEGAQRLYSWVFELQH
jgi:iron complex transport system substrate-binding protein